MRRSPTPRRRPTPAEVDGFRVGVAHSLEERRRSGAPDESGEADLRLADRAIARHALGAAVAILVRAHDRLSEAEPEREVAERPRGLVSFVAPGPPDEPTPPEEDRLRNRILLVTRLATLHDPVGGEVAEALAMLRRATAELGAGDREEATHLVNAAADRLDRSMARGRRVPAAEPTSRDR